MSTILQTEIPSHAKRKLTLEPGVPMYGVAIDNTQSSPIAIDVSYDRQDGVLRITICEARH